MQFTFRRQKTDELRFARSRQRTETEELLHHGFRMQFTKIKSEQKQTALAKPTAISLLNVGTSRFL
ncbi:hypothetical protein LEP1GSC133_3087 [Leptospira borgpetersenii serovar Pomona str. 200901868]|uniref:Uncharacterized protein n=1 Tax=Leptospira borgpetersenii serovar Pomona str. 200901868 TaxID=1192866 RepID=M6WHC3_LEPBO|nr:hypothetical protein LEP1GSC133_3087 [Leptospira borgpetersenii serovar Pomona str. 200901868]